jgi:hypothetical protein
MVFVGFGEEGEYLTVVVCQTGVSVEVGDKRDQEAVESDLLSAEGEGNFNLIEGGLNFTGSLDVEFAPWWDVWTVAGFPESAVVRGKADVVEDGVELGPDLDFHLILESRRSTRFSGIVEGDPDKATLTIYFHSWHTF